MFEVQLSPAMQRRACLELAYYIPDTAELLQPVTDRQILIADADWEKIERLALARIAAETNPGLSSNLLHHWGEVLRARGLWRGALAARLAGIVGALSSAADYGQPADFRLAITSHSLELTKALAVAADISEADMVGMYSRIASSTPFRHLLPPMAAIDLFKSRLKMTAG